MDFSISRRGWALAAAVSLSLPFSGALLGQETAPARPAFAVTSAKLNKNCTGSNSRPILSPGSFRLPCMPVRTLIRMAYSAFSGEQLNARISEVVGGPGWIDSERYDIEAKPEGKATSGELVGPMLQSLLEERFQLKVHKEPRETAVFILTVAESNPKIQPVKPGSCVPIDLFQEAARTAPSSQRQCGSYRGSPNPKGAGMSLDFSGMTMAEFAGRMLESYTGRPVIDRTGLEGRFDFHLDVATPRIEGPVMINGEAVTVRNDAGTEGDSIFTALQKQLGLKLTAGKAPVDVLVIDRVERPSEN